MWSVLRFLFASLFIMFPNWEGRKRERNAQIIFNYSSFRTTFVILSPRVSFISTSTLPLCVRIIILILVLSFRRRGHKEPPLIVGHTQTLLQRQPAILAVFLGKNFISLADARSKQTNRPKSSSRSLT